MASLHLQLACLLGHKLAAYRCQSTLSASLFIFQLLFFLAVRSSLSDGCLLAHSCDECINNWAYSGEGEYTYTQPAASLLHNIFLFCVHSTTSSVYSICLIYSIQRNFTAGKASAVIV